MWSFSLFLSSFKMLFLENHHLHHRLEQSHKLEIFHHDLELQIRFKWHPGFLLWILHKQFSTSSSPFVLCLGKIVLSMSLFQPFLSLAPYPPKPPTVPLWPFNQPSPMICVSAIFLTLPFSWYRLSLPLPIQSSCQNLQLWLSSRLSPLHSAANRLVTVSTSPAHHISSPYNWS